MPGVTRYDDLARAITDAYPRMPNRLQGIARFALDNPDAMALGTVAEIARGAAVPPSAVIRFAKALGYTGYLPMQHVYRERLVARSATYRERIDALRKRGADPGAVLPQLVDSAIGELERLREHVDPRQLRDAAQLVLDARTVHVLAQRRAHPLAVYLVYGLSQLEVPTHLLDNRDGTLMQHAAALRRDDLLIAASFRNYSAEVIEVADRCHQRGIPVVAFTDQPVSPLARSARVRFELEDNSALPFRSLVGALTAAQSLVIAVGYALAERRARRKPGRRT